MNKMIVAMLVAMLVLLVLATSSATAAQNPLARYNATSVVVVSRSGYALVTDGQAQTEWFGINDVIYTADGGKVIIIQEVKGGKLIGPIGWRYEGPDGNRSGVLQASYKYLPFFSEGSSVTLVDGKIAIIKDGKIVSNWVPMGQTFLTAEGGSINVLMEVKSGKTIGPRGWNYTGPDGSKSDHFNYDYLK